jgi:hypothetical protein
VRYKYVPYQYTEYQYVLLCHNTPSFSEDGSLYSTMLYTLELYSHVTMQRDVGTGKVSDPESLLFYVGFDTREAIEGP